MHNFAFNRKDKLPTNRYQSLLNNNSQKFFSRAFVFIYEFNSTLPQSYLGLAISKKKLKRANKRNLAKRLNREAFRLNNHNLPNVEVCVLASRHAIELERSGWQKCVKQFWKHLHEESKSLSKD